MRSPWTAACLLVALLTHADPAEAQQYLIGGTAEVASGVSAGGPSGGVMERARTRLRIGADLRVDEFPKDVFALAAVVALEPHASAGLDVRYLRTVTPRLDLSVGAVGFVFPGSLLGPLAAARYRLPVSKKVELMLGPEVDVFVVGTDLPSNSIVWQCLVQVGVHVDL
jgi:hypothetical protein